MAFDIDPKSTAACGIRPSIPGIRVIKRDPQAEAYAKRDAKGLIHSLARAYPDEFWDVVRKLKAVNATG